MHNDIIGEVVEVDMLEVVDKEDIALLLAGGASGTNRTEPGLRPHVVVPSLPDGVSSRLRPMSCLSLIFALEETQA